jgi:prepilin-type N-terminal cleavage/methylation domain-containing protein
MQTMNPRRKAFTLIELLIVVAIIAILAAIAVPNFLEAQTRAKVSRAEADMRTLSTGLEAFRIDHNEYPEGTDSPAKQPEYIVQFLGALAPGYYTFKSRDGALTAGTGFATLTTPVAYLTNVLHDPFAEQLGGRLTYCYRNAKDTKNGYIITSFGPDVDILIDTGKGTTNTNPLSTFTDSNSPSRMGDINERAVVHYIENTAPATTTAVDQMGGLRTALQDLRYDPTNGSISDGDLFRVGP